MGLHPKLVKTKAMYESGDAAIYANVGALIEHLTPDEFFGGDGRKESSRKLNRETPRTLGSSHSKRRKA